MNKQELSAELMRKKMTYSNIAEILGVTEMTFYRKINNMNEFKLSEIQLMASALNLDDDSIRRIFFDIAVE